ncbi:hypothetical protein MMC28_005604 [Mycoblastus sanguinarius]|nr:hypothetical protein [Mycoblastus sanguinarius]
MDELEVYGRKRDFGRYADAKSLLEVTAPRKKQAVTKIHSATTKALIQRNALGSPLLKMPAEVREQILLYILGDKVVHIKYFKDGELELVHSLERGLNSMPADRRAFRHAVCVAYHSESRAYKEASHGYRCVPCDDSAEYYIVNCAERHQLCGCHDNNQFPTLRYGHLSPKIDLAVLGSCRQLYEEAHHLIWTTNTFSFDDPISFGNFLANLSLPQKRKLKKLHLSRPSITKPYRPSRRNKD